ncbi:MAG TPA: LysR family transcriptional regulator [Rhizomicrobium sp.]|jgi:molybdate transport repressor ModE-like protein|nr:LysR family transcriptional regulator [Rhizomicrobium sp.]
MAVADIEVRHCRVLTAVADRGGIASAARALGLAQSTVSETLAALERVLGTPVLERRAGREAKLTAAAQVLLPRARALVAAAEAALQAVSAARKDGVRLGTVESVSSFLLPKPLAALRRQRPQSDVNVTIGVCEDLRKRVARFELDAAMTVEPAAAAARDGTRLLARAALRLVIAPKHPWARRVMRRAEFAGQTLLLTDAQGAFNGMLEEWFGAARPRFTSAGSIDGVVRAVRAGDAIGVLPDYAVAAQLKRGTLVALRVKEKLPAIAILLTTAEPLVKTSPLHALTAGIGAVLRRR